MSKTLWRRRQSVLLYRSCRTQTFRFDCINWHAGTFILIYKPIQISRYSYSPPQFSRAEPQFLTRTILIGLTAPLPHPNTDLHWFS